MVLGGAPDPPPRMDASSGSAAADPPAVAAGQEVEASAPPASVPEKMEGIEKLSSPPPVQGPSGKQILQTEDFWKDLQGFLEQRIKDEAEALRLVQKWRSAWNTG